LKRLHRRLVTSATYRQSALAEGPAAAGSAGRPSAEMDPENRWLSRFTVRRLQAEMIRDAMLAVSGELRQQSGGPSGQDQDLRRTIYTRVMRNKRIPLLAEFDAPDGFGSVSQRNVTTTPTQALLMINGSWSLARAQALAARLLKRPHAEPRQLAEAAVWRCLQRPAEPWELDRAAAFLGDDQTQLAARLTDYCHVLLNSNEFIYVD
jgi:hypothetical protein